MSSKPPTRHRPDPRLSRWIPWMLRLFWVIIAISLIAGLGSGPGGLFGLPAMLLTLIALFRWCPRQCEPGTQAPAQVPPCSGGGGGRRRSTRRGCRVHGGCPHDRPMRQRVVGWVHPSRVAVALPTLRV